MSNIVVANVSDILRFITDIPYFLYLCLAAVFRFIITCCRRKKRKCLDNDIILITGAATGLGREAVLQFARVSTKATYVLWDINEEGLNETLKLCKSLGANNIRIYRVDLSKHAEITCTADKLRQEVGNVTILFNNAGILQYNHFLFTSAEREEKTLQINLLSYMWTIREFLPGMIKMGKGQIVNTCSGLAFTRFRYLSAYVASKYGLRGFLECLKLEMRLHPSKPDIKFTTIYPGWIKTKMTGGITWKPRYNTCKGIQNMDPCYVAKKMVDGILRESEEIVIPRSILCLKYLYEYIPTQLFDDVLESHLMQNISIDIQFYSNEAAVNIPSIGSSEAEGSLNILENNKNHIGIEMSIDTELSKSTSTTSE